MNYSSGSALLVIGKTIRTGREIKNVALQAKKVGKDSSLKSMILTAVCEHVEHC